LTLFLSYVYRSSYRGFDVDVLLNVFSLVTLMVISVHFSWALVIDFCYFISLSAVAIVFLHWLKRDWWKSRSTCLLYLSNYCI